MVTLNAISSVPSGAALSSQDNVQRIARLPALSRESSDQRSSGNAGEDEAMQLQAKMLQAQIESLQQQLDGLQSGRDRSAYHAGSDAQSGSETPPADGINRPTAANRVNVYI
ncbi:MULTISPECIES: FlxA-like family protein [unclassified Brenneria]|uniref:FlxA-like family protein n=1 Tax=unclassified Brenneria TaxID=2634434 RepID=UPI0029C2084E|nr:MULTISPECIES: FlxA-like family protein [unclassified Brenneria]MDX5630196.1 FlxA-like family protein [Brenneria sp. L3-3Z]MDX5697341.1 FlxA-like family protein [Brenneria sp. L4-2C]MEE3664470.1 FlxA-like family protein [Brenneria sp. g21c3]